MCKTLFRISISLFFGVGLFLGGAFPLRAEVKLKTFTVFYVNDLHSRFKSQPGPMKLGGYPRIKTAFDQERLSTTASIFVDGGDWSEGDLYYTLGAGYESLRMLDALGVDVSVVGNHDWFNGPDHLLDTVNAVKPKLQLLAANLETQSFARAAEFHEKIPPYTLRTINGVKVAFIGLCTYEKVYDKLLAPVTVAQPNIVAHTLSRRLKRDGLADIVVAISHNSLQANRYILSYAPDLDIIVGAHDHKKLIQAEEIGNGLWRRSPGWLVEAQDSGKFLGRMDITFDPEAAPKDRLKVASKLIQIDDRYAEDSALKAKIEAMDAQLAAERSPSLNEPVAESKTYLAHTGGSENTIGNLVTNAYRELTQAEFALGSYKFLYGEVHPGTLSTQEIYNIMPAVYSLKTQKTWSVKVLSLPGRTVKRILDIGYGTNQVSFYGLVSVSGMSFTYDPWFSPVTTTPFSLERFFGALYSLFLSDSLSGISNLMVGNKPMDLNKEYRVAVDTGILEGIEFSNSYFSAIGQVLPFKLLEDTGIEGWAALKTHLVNMKVLEKMNGASERIKVLKQDLGTSYEDIRLAALGREGSSTLVRADVRVQNFGASPAPEVGPLGPNSVRLLINKNYPNLAVAPDYEEIGAPILLSTLNPGEKMELTWNVIVPDCSNGKPYPITVQIQGADLEINTTNNSVEKWL